ncbi:tRNA modification GTPase [Algibacter sp. 2305UL17-15]|uniref:tRNA modification GTPase n=1 Tax=Algibacter sp. 2305UL17-15 TaxID=3231268 RepID=UPI00345AEEB9
MKKSLILILFICFTSFINAQINFEKGYFINNLNEKKSCLIKNVDWKHNPTEFDYKFSEGEDTKTMPITHAKEFGVDNFSKFIRAEVDIDQSSKYTQYLSHTRKPEFKTQTVFLKVVLEGESNLYYYEAGNLARYFFNLRNTKIEPLIYKSYLKEQAVAAYNNGFRIQLMNALKCSSMKKSDFEYLNYDFNGLTKVILKYNTCIDPNYKILKIEKPHKSNLNISVKAGLRSGTFKAQEFRGVLDPVHDFGNDSNLTFGIELEHVFGFNQNKWAISIEPSYQSFQSEITEASSTSSFINKFAVDYKSVEVPLGVRHYMFLNQNSKLSLSAYYILDFPLDSAINVQRGTSNYDVEIVKSTNLALGFGYKYLDKYSVELRYNGDRKNTGQNWLSKYSSISLIFGYTIF